MDRPTTWSCIALVMAGALATASKAHADDRVVVRRVPGFSVVSESVTVAIERHAPPEYKGKQPVDFYFAAVKQLLLVNNIKEDWFAVPPDAYFISIEIELEGKKLVLTSAHTLMEKSGQSIMTDNAFEPLNGRDKASVLARQSLRLRQHREAFEKILRLSNDHMRVALD